MRETRLSPMIRANPSCFLDRAAAMRADYVLRAFSVFLAGLGVFVVTSGFQLKYYGVLGPGPGFFPIWIGSLLVGACLVLLGQSLFVRSKSERFFPSSDAAIRVLAVLLSLAAIWFALKYFGFRLAILLFTLCVPRILGRQSPVVAVAVALLASFGVAYAFEAWLGVPLPEPAFELLKALGF